MGTADQAALTAHQYLLRLPATEESAVARRADSRDALRSSG